MHSSPCESGICKACLTDVHVVIPSDLRFGVYLAVVAIMALALVLSVIISQNVCFDKLRSVRAAVHLIFKFQYCVKILKCIIENIRAPDHSSLQLCFLLSYFLITLHDCSRIELLFLKKILLSC